MDFNLSNICDMLSDRIEEYHTTSKKRRLERESCAPKSKMAKFIHDHHTGKKHNGSTMVSSTPFEVSKMKTKQLSAMFSSVTKLPTPITDKRNTRGPIIKARKLNFDDAEESANTEKKAKLEESTANLSSITVIHSLETLKKRRLQRTKLTARRLFANEDEQPDVESLSNDSASRTDFSKVLTPLPTPKRVCISKRGMNARRLSFSDAENEAKAVISSNKFLGEDKLVSIESMGTSTIMTLNVGIIVRPIRDFN